MKTNYTVEIQRRNVTPAQFLAYVRRRLKATGGDAFCGCLDLDYFAAGSEPNYDTERDGTHCISRSKPYDMQTYIREGGRLYNEIVEFEFDDEKTGHGYYYMVDAEEETTEAEPETETTETAPAAEPETVTETVEAETAETETAPAAETETIETAAETIEATKRAAEVADILDDVRCEITAGYYRKKRRVTARCIRESERAGVPTVRVGYCGAQWLLSYLTPAYYTAGVYGWNCDVYTVAGLNICTGYRGMVGEPAVFTADYERRARAAAGEDERNAILAEWIAANLDAIQAAREGVRA